ncbi:ubiquinone anaerobic biosynthesis protein UbiV [Paraburkholderia tropica]|uniref:ubiquinone anaerobic biosynthesis protein UbiV n=1 Tax=Paraburkholderia tropica TaxID=92647 RepID=UPI002AB5EBCD|nr:U32 family peptidase [Paraburkholderia tropica]
MKISLGPVQYYWPRTTLLAFYERVATLPVDIVYLGEVVCSRRHEMRFSDWMDVAARLTDAGKEVVLSTQTLLESGKDMRVLADIADNGRYGVEANDVGAVQRTRGKPFVAGASLNIFNPPTLDIFAEAGAKRWVAPHEMRQFDLRALQHARPAGMQTEVLAYGRLPLAYSARCFSARNRNFPKDNCQYVCKDYADGMLLETRELQPLFVLNGISTQTAHIYTLIDEIGTMKNMGVDIVRISPQQHHTEELVSLFHRVIREPSESADALAHMLPLMPAAPCNGYWHSKPGFEFVRS